MRNFWDTQIITICSGRKSNYEREIQNITNYKDNWVALVAIQYSFIDEKCGYIDKERSYMPEACGYMFVMKIVATFV